MDYFSDRERKPSPPTTSKLTSSAWKGIAVAIDSRIQDGSFGACYPEICQDGTVPCGTDASLFLDAIESEIPELYTLELSEKTRLSKIDPPSLFAAMDLIQFCWSAVGKPEKIGFHSFWSHHHLKFNIPVGRSEFRETINRIFSRNGMAYELTKDGAVERSMPKHISPVVHAEYRTGDSDLDSMLDKARRKFLDPRDDEHGESLQDLWDAWERAKTLNGTDKQSGIKSLLDQAAGSSAPKFRAALEAEAKALTSIGNNFLIRHSETDKEALGLPQHIDYFAFRMFSFVHLIFRKFRDASKEQSHQDKANDDTIPF